MPRYCALLGLFALLIAGCGGGASNASGTQDAVQEQPAPSSTAADSTAPRDSATAASVDTVRATRTWTASIAAQHSPDVNAVMLHEVRAGQHDDFDRVVFEFDGSTLPGYEIEYVDEPVRECGSGREVRLEGNGRLEVRLRRARAHTKTGQPTVADRERSLSMPVLKALAATCDFEGRVTWVLGLAAPNKYRVLNLQNPARLVIDVRQ